jgi:hypothetical protein
MKCIPFATKWPRIARFSLALVTVAGSICALAQTSGSPQYNVVDLGPVGAPPGQPYSITGHGLVSGEIVLANPAVSHAVVWRYGKLKDIGSPWSRRTEQCRFCRQYLGAGSRASRHQDARSEWRRLLWIEGAGSH